MKLATLVAFNSRPGQHMSFVWKLWLRSATSFLHSYLISLFSYRVAAMRDISSICPHGVVGLFEYRVYLYLPPQID